MYPIVVTQPRLLRHKLRWAYNIQSHCLSIALKGYEDDDDVWNISSPVSWKPGYLTKFVPGNHSKRAEPGLSPSYTAYNQEITFSNALYIVNSIENGVPFIYPQEKTLACFLLTLLSSCICSRYLLTFSKYINISCPYPSRVTQIINSLLILLAWKRNAFRT